MGYVPEEIRRETKLNLTMPPTDPLPLLSKVAREKGCRVFVETGTWMGGFLERMADTGLFSRLLSVETKEDLYRGCVERFRGRPNVRLYHGSSRRELLGMIPEAEKNGERIMFWLDAHYSCGNTGHDGTSECPLREELAQIIDNASRRDHVICIDDMRDMPYEPGQTYPSWDEIMSLLRRINPSYDIQVHEEHTGILVAC